MATAFWYDFEVVVGVPEATVGLYQDDSCVVEAVSDESGNAAFNIKGGVYTIKVDADGYDQLISENVTVDSNSKFTIESLDPTDYSVTVTVKDSQTAPIEGANVTLGDLPAAQTSSEGIAAIYAEVGDYQLVVSKDGYTSYDESVNVTGANSFDIVLEYAAANFELVFNDSNGSPVNGIEVKIDGNPIGSTDSTGKVTASVIPGQHTVSVEATATYEAFSQEVDFQFGQTSAGTFSLVYADAEYTVELSTALKGNVTLGENADTLNLAAAVEGVIDMGNGDDIVNLSAGAQFTSLSNAETLNVNGDFTVNAPAVDDVAAYNQLATATAVVIKAGTLTLGDATNISSITMEGGALTGAAYTGDVVVEGAAALSDITIDGSVTSSADLTLSGALYVANGLVLQQAVDADGNAVNTNIAIDSAAFNGNLSMLALSNTTGSDNQVLNVTVNGPISANGVYVEANGALTVTGNVTTGEIALDAGASVSVAGTLSGADLTLSNNGTAVFGAVAYTGTVTVAAGALSAASLTADTVSGKVEITGVLTGQNLSAVEAESQAGTLMFVGDTATFASANFVADTLTKIDFTSADLTGAVTDTSAVADWVSMAAKFDVFGTALKTGDFYTNANLADLDSLATTDDVTGDMSITFQDGIVFTKLSGGSDYEYTDANSNKYKLGLSGNTLGIASV